MFCEACGVHVVCRPFNRVRVVVAAVGSSIAVFVLGEFCSRFCIIIAYRRVPGAFCVFALVVSFCPRRFAIASPRCRIGA